MFRVGIPRALLYYQYYPMWRAFFESLGAEVVSSSPTDRQIFDSGLSLVPTDICLPVKVFCGHAAYLSRKCDFLFVPAVYSLKPQVYNCPKFIGLPDIVRASVPRCPEILEPDINLSLGKKRFYEQICRLARLFTRNPLRAERAIKKAREAHQTYQKFLRFLPPNQALQKALGREVTEKDNCDANLTLALIGHPYLLHDDYVNHEAVEKLHKEGIKILFPEQVTEERQEGLVREFLGRSYWTYEGEVVGAGEHYFRSKVDGVISLVAFGCGPDSLMMELVQRRAKRWDKPFLSLVLDEHTGKSALENRLDAFMDMVRRGKVKSKFAFQGKKSEKISLPSYSISSGRIEALGIPPMGNVSAAFRQSARIVGIEPITPPVTRRTLSLGSRYSPEFVCLPFKLILGSSIESLESGADALFMVTSFNACRMGYYNRLQEQILRELGYKFKFLRYESSGKNLFKVMRAVKEYTNNSPWSKTFAAYRLGINKLRALDELERKVQKLRPVEMEKESVNRIYREAVQAIDEAKNLPELKQAAGQYFWKMEQIPISPQAKPLKVGIIGEIYVTAEPFCNLNLEEELGRLGVEVQRNRTTFLSEWTRLGSYLNFLNKEKKKLYRFAQPYLRRDVGGHALESVAEKAKAMEELDGLIHLIPFTCMPESIAQAVSPQMPGQLPILPIILDEQTTKGALVNRLEAFVDLLQRRRQKSPKSNRLF